MIGRIYLIENQVNHKQYIGKTYNSIAERWKEHCKDYQKARCEKRPLYEAMNKYGIENFTVELIEETDNLEEREKYWVAYYDSYRNGYNATLGGDGRPYFEYSDEEVIKKFYELRNIKEVAEFFHCCTDTISLRLKNNNIDTKQFQFYSQKRHWTTKSIDQYSLQGEYLQTFETLTAAAQWVIDNNYSSGQIKHIVGNISKSARGIEGRSHAYGFIWKKLEPNDGRLTLKVRDQS